MNPRQENLGQIIEKKYIILNDKREDEQPIAVFDNPNDSINKGRHVRERSVAININSLHRNIIQKNAIAIPTRNILDSGGNVIGTEDYTAETLNAENWSIEKYNTVPPVEYVENGDTLYACVYKFKDPSEYEVSIPGGILSNVKSIELVNTIVPNSMNCINDTNGVITVDIIDTDGTSIQKKSPSFFVDLNNDKFFVSYDFGVLWETITLIHGRYTMDEFVSYLTSVLAFRTEYNSGKFTFGYSESFSIRVDTDGPYKELGFLAGVVYRSVNNTEEHIVISSEYSSINFTSVDYFMIRLNPGNYNINELMSVMETELNTTIHRESMEKFHGIFSCNHDSITGSIRISINKIYTLSTDNTINIKNRHSAEYTECKLKPGHYTSEELCSYLTSRLNNIGLTGTFAVLYDEYTGHFTIESDSSDFDIDMTNGPSDALGMTGIVSSENFDLESSTVTIDRQLKFCMKFWKSESEYKRGSDLWYLLGFNLPYKKCPDGTDMYSTWISNEINYGSNQIVGGQEIYGYRAYRKPCLYPDKYIYLTIEGFGMIRDISNTDVSTGIKNIFAKVCISNIDPGEFAIDSFVSTPVIYIDSVSHELKTLKIRWVDYKGDSVDFNGINHSFTLRVICYDDYLDANGYSSRRGVIDKSFMPESIW